MKRAESNPQIILSNHARDRALQYELRVEWIQRTILDPELRRADPTRAGITLSFRRIPEFGDRILRVAHRPEGDAQFIVTTFFDRKAKL